MSLYIEQFTDFETYADIGEYRIELPEKPINKKIINYGLPIEKQVFKRTKYKNWLSHFFK